MSLPLVTDWTTFSDLIASTTSGRTLLQANDYSAFSELVKVSAKAEGYAMQGSNLVKTGNAVGSIAQTSGKVLLFPTYATEGVTGGVSTATQVATIAETETGITATTVGASAGGVSVGAVVGGVMAGLGLGVVAYESNPQFWIGVSNAIFGTDIEYEQIKDLSITALFKNGKTYIPDETVQKISEYLISSGAYNMSSVIDVNNSDFVLNETRTFYTTPFTKDTLAYIVNKAYEKITYKSRNPDLRLLLNEFWNRINEVFNPTEYNCVGVDIRLPQNKSYPSINLFIWGYNSTDNSMIVKTKTVNGDFVGYSCEILNAITPTTNNYCDVQWFQGNIATTNPTIVGSSKYCVSGYKIGNEMIESGNINSTTRNISGVVDILPQQNAVYPTGSTPLPLTYPTWYNNKLTIGGMKPDKSGLQNVDFLPIELPSVNPMENPLDLPQAQAQLGDVTTPYQQQEILDALQRLQDSIPDYPYIQNPPSSDIGNTPTTPTVLPSASASGLISIYNPTLSEVNGLGAYLWSTNFVEQIVKLFQNPMDAIIGLHILYGTPSINGRGHIKVGYLDTGIESNLVNNQYITINCGTIQVAELNGNATDYPPFTRTSLYLPFIGIVELNGYDIIGSSVNIEYKIDVLTGCCLANVSVNKNSSNAILYTYNGNCAVQLPLTGGNYASMISGLIGVGLGAMTGGVGMVVAGVMGAVTQGATVQHSGCLGSNSGAMGIKKPYLIVTRFVPYDAVNYNNYYGYPSNNTYKISELTGYTKVKEIRLNGINATNKEKMELETILKNGVIF